MTHVVSLHFSGLGRIYKDGYANKGKTGIGRLIGHSQEARRMDLASGGSGPEGWTENSGRIRSAGHRRSRRGAWGNWSLRSFLSADIGVAAQSFADLRAPIIAAARRVDHCELSDPSGPLRHTIGHVYIRLRLRSREIFQGR